MFQSVFEFAIKTLCHRRGRPVDIFCIYASTCICVIVFYSVFVFQSVFVTINQLYYRRGRPVDIYASSREVGIRPRGPGQVGKHDDDYDDDFDDYHDDIHIMMKCMSVCLSVVTALSPAPVLFPLSEREHHFIILLIINNCSFCIS